MAKDFNMPDDEFRQLNFFQMLDETEGDLTRISGDAPKLNAMVGGLVNSTRVDRDKLKGVTDKTLKHLTNFGATLDETAKVVGKNGTGLVNNMYSELHKTISSMDQSLLASTTQASRAIKAETKSAPAKVIPPKAFKTSDYSRRAIRAIRKNNVATAGVLQKELNIPKNQAKQVLKDLESKGIVGPGGSGVARTLNLPKQSYVLRPNKSKLASKQTTAPLVQQTVPQFVPEASILNNRRLEQVRKILRNDQTINAGRISKSLGIDKLQTRDLLKEMVGRGYIKNKKVAIAPASNVSAVRIGEIKNSLKGLTPGQRALYREVNMIQDPKKRQIAMESIKHFPPAFFSNATSASGLHHAKWQNDFGGNVAHTRDMMQAADRAFKNPKSTEYRMIRELAAERHVPLNRAHMDDALMGMLLHDADKFSNVPGDVNANTNWQRGDINHSQNPFGRMLPPKFQQRMIDTLGSETVKVVRDAVESHGGKHEVDSNRALASIRSSPVSAIVHRMDGISADPDRPNMVRGSARVRRILGLPSPEEMAVLDRTVLDEVVKGRIARGSQESGARRTVWNTWKRGLDAGANISEADRTHLANMSLPSGIGDEQYRALISAGGNLGTIQRSGMNPQNVIDNLVAHSDSLNKLKFKDRYKATDSELMQLQYLNPKILSRVAENVRSSRRPEDAAAITRLSGMLDQMITPIVRNNTSADGRVNMARVLRDIGDRTLSSNAAVQETRAAVKSGTVRAGTTEAIQGRRVNQDAVSEGYRQTTEEKKASKENAKATASLARLRRELAQLTEAEIRAARMTTYGNSRATGPLDVTSSNVDSARRVLQDATGHNSPRLLQTDIDRAREEVRAQLAGQETIIQEVRNSNQLQFGSPNRPIVTSGGSGGGSGGYSGPPRGPSGYSFSEPMRAGNPLSGSGGKGLMWNMQNSMWAMALPMTGIGSFIQLIREATTAVKEHELAIINVGRVWDGPKEDLKRISQDLTDIAIKYGDTIPAVGKIQEEWVKTGIKDPKTLNSLTNTTELALNTSDIEDSEQAVKYLNSAIKQMGLDYGDAEKLLDSWNKTADQFPADTKDFADGFQIAGSYARNLGLDMHDLNALLSILIERTGKTGTETATALRMMFSNIFIPKSVKVLEDMGVEMHQIDKTAVATGEHIDSKFRPFLDIITDMSVKAKELKSELGVSLFSEKSINAIEGAGVQMHLVGMDGKEVAGQFREVEDIITDIDKKGIDLSKLSIPSEVSAKLIKMARTLGETRRMNFGLSLMEGLGDFDKVRAISESGVTESYSQKKNDMTMQSLSKQAGQLKASFTEAIITFSKGGTIDAIRAVTVVLTDLFTGFSNLNQRVPILNMDLTKLVSTFLTYKAVMLLANKTTQAFIGTTLSAKGGAGLASIVDGVRSLTPFRNPNTNGMLAYRTMNSAMNNPGLVQMIPNEVARREAVTGSLVQLGIIRQRDMVLTAESIAVGNIENTMRASNVQVIQGQIIARNADVAVTSEGNIYRRASTGLYVLEASAIGATTDARVANALSTVALTPGLDANTAARVINNTATGESILVTDADTLAKIADAEATAALAAAQKAAASSAAAAALTFNIVLGVLAIVAMAYFTASSNAEDFIEKQYESAMSATESSKQVANLFRQYEELENLIKKDTTALEEANKSGAKDAEVKLEQSAALTELNKHQNELLDVQKSIAGISKDLIDGYDNEGKAIVKNTEAIKEYIKWKDEARMADLQNLADEYTSSGADKEAKLAKMKDEQKLLGLTKKGLIDATTAGKGSAPSLYSLNEGIKKNPELSKAIEDYNTKYPRGPYKQPFGAEDLAKLASKSDPWYKQMAPGPESMTTNETLLDSAVKSYGKANTEIQELTESLAKLKSAKEQVDKIMARAKVNLPDQSVLTPEDKELMSNGNTLIGRLTSGSGVANEQFSDEKEQLLEKYLRAIQSAKDPYTKSFDTAWSYLKDNTEGLEELAKSYDGDIKKIPIKVIEEITEKSINSSRGARLKVETDNLEQTKQFLELTKTRMKAIKAEMDLLRTKAMAGTSMEPFNPFKKPTGQLDKNLDPFGMTAPGGPLAPKLKEPDKALLEVADEKEKKYKQYLDMVKAYGEAIAKEEDTIANLMGEVNLNPDYKDDSATKYKELNNVLKILDNMIKKLQTDLQILDTLWQDDADNLEYLNQKADALKSTETTLMYVISRLRISLSSLSPTDDEEKYTEIQEKISGYTQSLFENMQAQEQLKRTIFDSKISDLERDLANLTKQFELNSQAINNGAGSYDTAALKLQLYKDTLSLVGSKASTIRAEIERVKDTIISSSYAANTAGNEFRRMFEGVQAKTLPEYLEKLKELLLENTIEAGKAREALEESVVTVLKEGYNKQLELANDQIDANMKREKKRHDEFMKNKQAEMKALDDKWKKEDRDKELKDVDDKIGLIDTKLSRLRRDSSQYGAKLRKDLELEKAKLVDQKNEMIKADDRDKQKKVIQESMDTDTSISNDVTDNLEKQKEDAGKHFKGLVDNAEFYGKGLVETYTKTQFDILKVLYGLVPEYENVAKQAAGAYSRGLNLQKSLVPDTVANIYGMSGEDFNRMTTNGNKYTKAVAEGKPTDTEELVQAKMENDALRSKYNLPKGYYPMLSNEYFMNDEDYGKMTQNGKSWEETNKKLIADKKELEKLKRTPSLPPDYGLGNIDLNNRPRVKNNDGSISTVSSMSFNEDNKEILIPTIREGLDRAMSTNEAIDWYHKNGEYLGKFDTVQQANDYAEKLHLSQEKLYTSQTDSVLTTIELNKQIALLEVTIATNTELLKNLNQDNNVLRDKYLLPTGAYPTKATGTTGMTDQELNDFTKGGSWYKEQVAKGLNHEQISKLPEYKTYHGRNEELRTKYGMEDMAYPKAKNDYGMTDKDYTEFLSNGKWWEAHNKDYDWNTPAKQAEFKTKKDRNDYLRKVYTIPTGEYPRLGTGVTPYANPPMRDRVLDAAPYVPKDIDKLVTARPNIPKNISGENPNIVNNSFKVDRAINIENATFQDPVDYEKLEDMASKKLQSNLSRKGVRISG